MTGGVLILRFLITSMKIMKNKTIQLTQSLNDVNGNFDSCLIND